MLWLDPDVRGVLSDFSLYAKGYDPSADAQPEKAHEMRSGEMPAWRSPFRPLLRIVDEVRSSVFACRFVF